jgi:hypothetical protein
MTFLLYETSNPKSAQIRYRQVKEVKLAGKREGLIFSACERFLGNQDVGWTITASDMLIAGGYDPASNALVIDAAPNRKGYVLLMQIQNISGYTYPDWTPLMLTMEHLFADEFGEDEAPGIKAQFDDAECPRSRVREFLYLMGGYASGGWTWGGNSRTTAALLWDDAWTYFSKASLETGSDRG